MDGFGTKLEQARVAMVTKFTKVCAENERLKEQIKELKASGTRVRSLPKKPKIANQSGEGTQPAPEPAAAS